VELLDVSSELPELKRRPGLTSWLVGYLLDFFISSKSSCMSSVF